MPSKPKNSDDVYKVMLDYCFTKQLNFSDSELKIMAECCYLTFESKGWKGITYWPPLAKRWVLTTKKPKPTILSKPHGESVRDKILKKRDNDI